MSNNLELSAMSEISEILEGLSDEEANRVVRWAVDKYGKGEVAPRYSSDPTRNDRPKTAADFESLADLFVAADPKYNADKALVVGYWLQEVEGQPDGFRSRDVNEELRNLGHQLSDITSAFRTLMKRSPKHAMQTDKKGSSRQGRKLYKLTPAGRQHVSDMLSEEAGEDGS